MSIKTKAKEMATKSKEFLLEHRDTIHVIVIGVGCFCLGQVYAVTKCQEGFDRLLNANVFGLGVRKGTEFVEVSQEEVCAIIKAYNKAHR